MCPIVLRLIIAMYYLTNDASKMGRNFIKTIPSWKLGLTRGCMISVLFTVYLDNLLKTIKQCNIECKIGYLGVIVI